MAISVMTDVWEKSRARGTELLLLLAIADFANQDGVAYPSVPTLAKKIRMSERNTHYLLKKLATAGELEIMRNAGPRGCNLFRVQTLQYANFAGVQSVVGRGANGSTKVVQSIAPEPSLNRQEQSFNVGAAQVLDYLNKKAGRTYKPVPANLKLIAARLKEGATADECRKVIDAKVAAWLNDSKMREYLRPATLFNAIKYAQYAGELGQQAAASGGESWE